MCRSFTSFPHSHHHYHSTLLGRASDSQTAHIGPVELRFALFFSKSLLLYRPWLDARERRMNKIGPCLQKAKLGAGTDERQNVASSCRLRCMGNSVLIPLSVLTYLKFSFPCVCVSIHIYTHD